MALYKRKRIIKELASYGQKYIFTKGKNQHSFFKMKYIPYIRLTIFSTICGLWAYDGIVHESIYMGSAIRFVRSIKTAALITADYLILDDNDDDYDRKLKEIHKKSANRLLRTCLVNGGLYIKVGQGCAVINHLLPVEYTSTLALLQDKCITTSKRDVQNVFVEDFGRKPEELFKEFDYNAIAAASIAQVFKATLNDGQQVAVKVQYGDLQKRFISDLGTIILINNIMEFFFRSYSFGWMLREVRDNLLKELNFINEAKNAERCAKDLQILGFVHIPKVYWPYTKQRVLTLEWIDAYKISDIKALEENKMKLTDVDYKLFQMFSEQIFSSGFVHADPHPSNVFVRRNNKTGKTEIVLLDHGLYEELNGNIKQLLCEFWVATILRDERRMLMSARQLGVCNHIRLAEVLLQQRVHMDSRPLKTKLSDSDIKILQKEAQENFDSIIATLKEMPSKMLFVVRNLNTIRAIGRMHGDVVNRPRVMARYAQYCLYKQNNSFKSYFVWLYRRIYFEYSLWFVSPIYIEHLNINILISYTICDTM